MKIRITILFAMLLFGVSFYSCSNDDETPEQETVAEEENQEDSDEDTDDESDDGTEEEGGDGTSDEEGGEDGDTSDEEGSDGGSGEGDGSDNGDADGSGDGNGDSGDGNGDSGDGNGDSSDGNGDSGDGNGDSSDGNGDSSDGNGDSGDNSEEEGSTDDVGPVINVTAPQNGQVFQQGDQVNVDTDISDDSDIAFARLFINGMLLRQENVAPYQWGTNNPNDAMLSSLAPGNYMLNVVAEDEFGNSSESTLSITVEAGSGDEDSGTGDGGNGDGGNDDGGNGDGNNGNPTTSCSNPGDAEFVEENGLVVAEFENNSFPGNWDFRTNVSDFQGSGFMVWTGSQSFNDPGNGLVRFKIRIQNPGTYRFIWRSAVTIGDNGTEHNDTWLRFNDADDYFGRKSSNGNIVYPRGTGKTPNPNGSSKDGWFKIYRSGNNLGFKWQSSTSDNDGHNIFVTFNSPGVYTMEVSARSSGHAIDRFVLFDEDDYSPNQATSASNPVSTVNCN